MTDIEILSLLKKEMVPAMGCTEPAASALAGARAMELLGALSVDKAVVRASGNMIKNAMGVGLPGCSQKGILMAVALGMVKADTSEQLNILSRIYEEDIKKAQEFKLELELAEGVPQLYVSVEVFSSSHSACATISGEHNRFSYCRKDDTVLLNLPLEAEGKNERLSCEDPGHSARMEDQRSSLLDLRIEDIKEFADRVNYSELGFIREAIDVNRRISQHAMHAEFGLQVGKTTSHGMQISTLSSLPEAFSLAASYAAAGSDARMSGCSMPVIINSGSGNQGLTVTLPLYVLSSYLKTGEEKL
ncbi:MAG: L-serine ammonia-lyase, iron-sulfur-dependent, subunit alpha, partial [Sphaerochaetaceae bacterium]|nr:L-serine ammonia-lyase, iron-sulfur-dependent, subunit alpha [Sphaerochaetaceae bacterium]